MSITFSTAWYILQAKFDPDVYATWIYNMISCVHNYNLVIYADEIGMQFLKDRFSEYLINPHIKIVLKPLESFYNYKYKDQWIQNHKNNHYLNGRTEWKLHMLWAEKVHFVDETCKQQYFDTDFYGWCDIGYFRDCPCPDFPSCNKIEALNPKKIYYACVNNNHKQMNSLMKMVNNKNRDGLPMVPLPPQQISVAAGFFIVHRDRSDEWKNTFDKRLHSYFKCGYFVKDDQIIVIDCIFSDLKSFCFVREPDNHNSSTIWFLFQRYLQ